MMLDGKTRQALKHILDYLEDIRFEARGRTCKSYLPLGGDCARLDCARVVGRHRQNYHHSDDCRRQNSGGHAVKGIRTVTGAASAAFFFFSCI